MLYRTFISSFLVAAAFAFSPSTPAQASGIEGKVRGADGRPVQNAEVRIQRQDKTGAPVTIQTDAKGRYVSSKLPAGTYRVSVVQNGAVKSNVTMKTVGEPARIDFDLQPTGRTIKHYVLVSGSGTHLAAQWIEVDANGTPIAGWNNTINNNGQLVRDMARHQVNNVRQ
jgi:hypothetical protein